MKVIFLKLFLGASNRQPQPSRENLKCYPLDQAFLGWKWPVTIIWYFYNPPPPECFHILVYYVCPRLILYELDRERKITV